MSEGADPMPSQSAGWMPVRAGLTISASFAMICVSVTAASLTPAANAPDGMLGAVGDLAEVLVDDSAWLLPLLFGAVLAALAVLVGQSFTGLPPADVDVNRRRLAAMCWVVAGVAVADLVVVAIGAALRAALAPHVWAVTVASALIVASALWVGSVVFGPPEQQLRVLAHTIDEAERDAARIPPANRSGRPWLRLLTSAAATSATAAILAVGLVVVVMSVEGRWGGFGVVGSLAVWSAVLASAGCLPAALAAALMQSSESVARGGLVGGVRRHDRGPANRCHRLDSGTCLQHPAAACRRLRPPDAPDPHGPAHLAPRSHPSRWCGRRLRESASGAAAKSARGTSPPSATDRRAHGRDPDRSAGAARAVAEPALPRDGASQRPWRLRRSPFAVPLKPGSLE
ncbi:MAG: hypothetical protein K0S65_5246 [Labilithrix sp.]|nr:hypothetical protein [Labilithrix sp.]